MSALEFRFDWDPPDDTVLAPEIRATWARLEILVDGNRVTFVEDIPTGSVRRSIYVPLYPLAEWVAFSWWLLLFDARLTGPIGAVDRRNIRCAGDGIIWPNIAFRSAGSLVSVRWAPGSPLTGNLIRYLGEGQAWIELGAVRSSLGELVQKVVERLRESNIHGTPLQAEWARVTAMDADEAEFCEAAARLGLDPFSEGIEFADTIVAASEHIKSEIRADFFDSVQPEGIEEAVSWVTRSLEKAKRLDDVMLPGFNLQLVASAVGESVAARAGWPPWGIGYTAASALRQELGISASSPFPDDLPVLIEAQPANISGFSAVGTTRPDAPWTGLVVRTPHRNGRRFAAARAMWHAAAGAGAYLLTSAASTPQQTGGAPEKCCRLGG